MGLQGTGLSDSNVRLRFLIVILMGVVAFGSILYWRSQLLVNAEYVQIDVNNRKKRIKDPSKLKSQNYELETMDASPSIN